MNGVESLNHTAICVHDLVAALDFYCNVLGAKPNQRSNFQTEDALAGVAIFQSVVLEDYLLALTVAPDFMLMPPDDQLRGALGFRHGFVVAHKRFGEVQDALHQANVAFAGPVDHPEQGPLGQSIYFKDPSGNFLEILWRRDEPTTAGKRRYVSVE
jgi:catechol 2,3-dioxygenase-like lactoylglutathione lyase family enzyme